MAKYHEWGSKSLKNGMEVSKGREKVSQGPSRIKIKVMGWGPFPPANFSWNSPLPRYVISY